MYGFPGGGGSGKEPAGDGRETGSVPRSGRCPGGEHATHFSILAWGIPWAEQPGGLHTAHRVAKSRTRLK